ncbi:MAG: MFS transporter [Burkholderiaceae bacterium]
MSPPASIAIESDDASAVAVPAGAAAWQTHGSLALMLLLGLVGVVDMTITGALITPLKQAFALSDEQLARLTSVFNFAGMVGAPVFGWFASRHGRKASIVLGAVVWSIGSIASGFAGGLTSLLLWRALTGFGEAAYNGLAASWLADLYRPRARPLVMAAYMVKNKVGVAVAMALGGWAAARWGWEAAFLIAGAPGLLFALLLARVREPVAGVTDGEPPLAAPRRIGFREGLVVLRHPGFVIHTVAVLLFYVGMIGQSWIPAFLHRAYDIDNKTASLYLAQVMLYTLPAGLIGGFLAGRYLRAQAWAFPLFLAATMLLAAAQLWLAYSVHDEQLTRWLIGTATATFGLSMGPMTTLSMETVPPALRPHATFLFVPVLGIATILAAQALGLASDAFGLDRAILISPAGYLGAGLVWLVFLGWWKTGRARQSIYY